MLFVQLDVNWVDNPKVMLVGLDGAGLHAAAMCMAKRMETDGVLHRIHLLRVGATDDLIDRLVDVGLLDAIDGQRVVVHDWLDRNPSRNVVAKSRSARSASGKRGNHSRYGHPGDVDDCEICNPKPPPEDEDESRKRSQTSWSLAGSSQTGSQGLAWREGCDRNGSLETETETETETEGKKEDPPGETAERPPKRKRPKRDPHPDARRLCEMFADTIGERDGNVRPSVTNEWVTDMDRLLRLDKRSPEQVEGFIRWLADGTHPTAEWWQPNIRSPKTLRKQWDKVREQRDAENRRRSRRQSPRGSAAERTARALDDTIRMVNEDPFFTGQPPPGALDDNGLPQLRVVNQ